MSEWSTPGWLARWPQCRLLLELARLCVQNGRPESLKRLKVRLQVCRIRMRGAPLLVDNTLSELWLAVGMAMDGDPGAFRHLQQAWNKAERVESLRRQEVLKRAAEMRSDAQLLRARTRQLRERSTLLRAQARHLVAEHTADPIHLPRPDLAAFVA
jgi:hypothetical protein